MTWSRSLLASVLSALTFVPGAFAQTGFVRSGEHDGFTRLVVEIGADRDWSLNGAGTEWTMTFDPVIADLDTSQVYNRIGRGRVAALQADDRLAFRLGCDCGVTAFRFDNRFVVIDIAETTEDTESEPDVVASQDDGAVASVAPAIGSLPDWTAPPPVAAPATVAETADDASEIDLDDAARIMAEQLARAAASGLLEAADGRPLTDADPLPNRAIDGGAATDDTETASAPLAPPLRASTATDAAQRPPPGLFHQADTAAPMGCGHIPSIATPWTQATTVSDGLGTLRAAVFDDRDRPVPDAVQALALHYLHFGFGAEAAYWLRTLPDPPTALLALSGLIEGADSPQFTPLDDLDACTDDEILWRYLDGVVDLSSQPIAIEAIERATAALPPVLRAYLGPRLARRLAADGATNAAHTVRDLLELSGVLSTTRLLHLDLDLGIPIAEDPAHTRAALEAATRDGSPDPARAIAQLMRFDRISHRPPDTARLIAAEAVLREQTAAGAADLWREVVLARAREGALDHVLAHLAQPPALSRTAPLWQSTFTLLIAERAESGDTLALLVLAHQHGVFWTESGSEAGRARIAAMAHLRAAGFSAAADGLRGGHRPLILPARPGAPPDPEAQLRAAWHGSDWRGIAQLGEGSHAAVAARMLARTDGETEPPSTLPEIAARLEDSHALRATVAALIDDPTPRLADQESGE